MQRIGPPEFQRKCFYTNNFKYEEIQNVMSIIYSYVVLSYV